MTTAIEHLHISRTSPPDAAEDEGSAVILGGRSAFDLDPTPLKTLPCAGGDTYQRAILNDGLWEMVLDNLARKHGGGSIPVTTCSGAAWQHAAPDQD